MHQAERFKLAVLLISGLLGVLSFGLWWFQPLHVQSWPMFLLLTMSMWFFILRGIGYWVLMLFLAKPDDKPLPAHLTVDAFTTAAPGEPVEMTQACLLALKNMTYPHETYLLDDSHNPQLKAFCQAHQIHYLTRHDKKDAKCGNVNHGLKHSQGEFVLIVDPDHLVKPDYLDHVLGHFEDPAVGFVQTTQAYRNQDKSFIAKAGAEQTFLFYGPIMTAMGRLGSNLVIGTNCTFRRTALESIGWYKPGLAEDLHTSMALHARGWKSVYVPKILAEGYTPEDLSSFCHQQLKWSRGVLELALHRFATHAKGWSWVQRGLYLLSITYYIESIMMLINLLLPVLYLWTNQVALNTTMSDFAVHLAPWLMVQTALFFYTQRWLCDPREKGLMWRGILLQFLCYPVHLLGIVYALAGRQIPYLPTAKTPSSQFPVYLMVPHLALILITLLGMGLGFCKSCEALCWGMLGFAVYNIVILLWAMGASYVSHQQLFNRPVLFQIRWDDWSWLGAWLKPVWDRTSLQITVRMIIPMVLLTNLMA